MAEFTVIVMDTNVCHSRNQSRVGSQAHLRSSLGIYYCKLTTHDTFNLSTRPNMVITVLNPKENFPFHLKMNIKDA